MTNAPIDTEMHNAAKLENLGAAIIRYGLAIVLLWVGMLKFTAYEAEGIKPFVENSPLLSWAYSITSVRGFARVLGVIEILLGILIASRRVSPKASAIGSVGSMIMFLITLSFILSTPGVWQAGYGFPFLSSMGQSLAKDLLLFGAATWTAGKSLIASNLESSTTNRKMYS